MQNLQKLLKKHADKIRFVLVGGTNTIIDFTILFTLVNYLGIAIVYGNVISTSVALTFSYFVNKKFTFKDNSPTGKSQLIRFLLVTLTGLWLIQPIIIAFTQAGIQIANISINRNYILFIGKIIATCITLIWNYVLYKKYVFIEKSDNKDKES